MRRRDTGMSRPRSLARRNVALLVRADEAGSVSVFAAAVLFLVGILCLAVVDLMRAAQGRARAQTAADAAALAAAQEIAIPSSRSPGDLAADFAARNGATVLSCSCSPGASEAVVTVSLMVPMVFLGPDRHVEATARAIIEGAGGGEVGRMAPDAQAGASDAERAGTAAGGGRLHAGEARAAAELPHRAHLASGHLRRPSRAPPGGPVPGRGGDAPMSGL